MNVVMKGKKKGKHDNKAIRMYSTFKSCLALSNHVTISGIMKLKQILYGGYLQYLHIEMS